MIMYETHDEISKVASCSWDQKLAHALGAILDLPISEVFLYLVTRAVAVIVVQ